MTLPQPEKFNLNSLDIAEDNRAKLKALFPSVFAEARNDEGELVESIDFEKLKAEIGSFSEAFENRRERYGMDWPGKKDCIKLVQQPATGTLKPCREESVNFDSTENLFIEGDNLEVLKLLQKSYYGKVKMIYIDPPYNTGKEFIYPDHYAETLETYLAFAGLVDDEGKKFSTNTANEGRFHTRWLNMMYPRLYLARNLLREDGVIFISIDDHEVAGLRNLCNDIFGEDSFVASVIWQKVFSPKNSARHFSEDHDYLLVYARNSELWTPYLLPRTKEMANRYSNPDEDERGPWASSDLSARNYYGEGLYPITCPSGRIVEGPPPGTYWRFKKQRFLELDEDQRIWWGGDGNNTPRLKRFLSEVKQGRVPQTMWLHKEVGHTQEAKKELIEYVKFENTENVLNSVKPTRLLQRALQIGTSSSEKDIVLDFFSGSAPTAHAVFKQNLKDGGDRKFVLVQLPEPLKTPEEKVKTIADLGKSRITNVIREIDPKQLNKSQEAAETLPDMDEEVFNLDLGFKVLKLDRSNFNLWDGSNPNATADELVQQLELHIDPIDPAATQEDILYELLLKSGFMPTEKIEKRLLAGKTVYAIAENTLLVCLEDEITRELIDAVVATDFQQFLCLDKAFKGNDQLKANAVQTFNTLNQDRDKERQIIFKTV